MRARAAVLLAVTAAVAVGLLGGCTEDHPGDGGQDGRRSSGSGPAPALGGPTPARHRPPHRAMDALERPVAVRLARQIAAEDLSLDYLDCPHWDGTVPSAMTCRGYVEGLVTRVPVHLLAAKGRRIVFDARMGTGVVATRRLEDTLRSGGWSDVDCGDVAAYPAQVGTRIVCRVRRGSEVTYVVATVRSQAGRVTIADYERTAAAP